jgi:SWIM zinc finger
MYIQGYHMTNPQLFHRYATERQLTRQVKAVDIASNLQVKRKNKLHFKVKSQSEDGIWYDVIKRYGHNIGGHQEGEWTCNCLDFIYRHVICKHIYAVTLWKEERKTVTEDVLPILCVNEGLYTNQKEQYSDYC